MGLNASTEAIKLQFSKLATFPFEKVVNIMTSHVRELLRKALQLPYQPYTQHQLNALVHLNTLYPTDTKTIDKFSQIRQLIKEIESNVYTATTIERLMQSDGAIFKLTAIAYTVPDKYYWIVADELHHLYTQLNQRAPQDTTINAVRDYLQVHALRKYNNELASFDTQLVDDVTTLLQYRYPHPESYLGVKLISNILSSYYTEQAASKLFVFDVKFKIHEYLESMEEILGEKLITITRERLHPTDKPAVLSLDEKYQLLLDNLASYLVDGKKELKQTILELAHDIMKASYMDTLKLTNFAKTMSAVDQVRSEEVE